MREVGETPPPPARGGEAPGGRENNRKITLSRDRRGNK